MPCWANLALALASSSEASEFCTGTLAAMQSISSCVKVP